MKSLILSLILIAACGAGIFPPIASAGHHGNNVQAIVIQKQQQQRRPFRRNDVQKLVIVDNGHNQNFRQQFNGHHHGNQQLRLNLGNGYCNNDQAFRQAQYEAELLRQALRQQSRQQLNGDCPCNNGNVLQFNGNQCQSLYR